MEIMKVWSNYNNHLHPLFKLGILIILNVLAFTPTLQNSYLIRLSIIIIEIILTILVKVKWGDIKFFAVMMFINSFAIFALFYISVFDLNQAIIMFVDYTLTISIMFLGTFIFWKTTPNNEFIQALTMLKIPKSITFAMMIALTFLPVLSKEVNKIITYQKSRGYKTSILNFGPIIIPTILSVLNLSTNLSISLESRGFKL